MSSILTNNGAMVALQTLRGINDSMAMTQNEISTGKSVSSAKDNAAVWAISKVMESDVKGFEGISDSLSLGKSTVAVARNASESITDLLKDIKGKIVAAQEENVDRDKIQTDIVALRNQIKSVVGAAQFNGLNLIDGTATSPVKILSSLDRASDGTVTASKIDVATQNLSVTTPVTAAAFGTVAAGAAAADAEAFMKGSAATRHTSGTAIAAVNTATVASGATETVSINSVAGGVSYQIDLQDINVKVEGGGTTVGDRKFQYVASATDGAADVAKALQTQLNAFFGVATDSADGYTATLTGPNKDQIAITHTNGTDDLKVSMMALKGGTAGSSPSSGGLGNLQTLDVTTDSGAASALTAIEGLIGKSIDAAASFGSSQKRIDIQSNFVSKLTDSLRSGIGAMVDANMEETSARLQALQVQQQLGTQALSIANKAPQALLSLFR